MRHRLTLAALPLLIGAAAPRSGFEAHGTDPKWSVKIAENSITFAQPSYRRSRQTENQGNIDKVERASGRVTISATLYEPQLIPMGKGRDGETVYYVESSEWTASIEVTEAACTDAKHRSFPTQVVVSTEGGQQYRGCGGSLAELEAGLKQPQG
jgi:uncharacterized membrane protein